MNYGLIHESIRPDIGFIGGVGGELEDILTSGDWEPYLPEFEAQSKPFETMNCVQFSRLNVCETQANFYNKKINKSDRFLGWASGCTANGNTFGACDYGLRQKGVCDEPLWPFGGSSLAEYHGTKPTDQAISNAKDLSTLWDVGMLVWVPATLDSLSSALKKGPIWFCNSMHAMMIYKIDDRIRVFDTYGTGKGSFPLSYVSEIVAAYLAPFKPKQNVPMIKLPPNSLVVVVDGHGERLMNVDGTKLYQDDPAKIITEVMARNAVDGMSMPFPIVHVKTSDIALIPRYNLKGEAL